MRSLDPAMVVWAARAPRRPDRRPKGSRHKILELTQTLETSVAQSHLAGGLRPSVATRKRCPPKHGVKEGLRAIAPLPRPQVCLPMCWYFSNTSDYTRKALFSNFCCILPKSARADNTSVTAALSISLVLHYIHPPVAVRKLHSIRCQVHFSRIVW